jgi:HlyD family secretion protein
VLIPLVIVALLAVVGWQAWKRINPNPDAGTLYGNVEIRQVDLAFNAEGRLERMDKREGDKVRQGELIAQLETDTYRDLVALATARRDSARANLDLLLAGTRPETIDRLRGALSSAQASLTNASATFARQEELAKRDVASRQAFDDARMNLDSARAAYAQAIAALNEAVAGPRAQEIDAARATLREAEASLRLANTSLGHTKLTAPFDGTIMTRVVEPGTVLLPTAIVYSMAIDGEVWVRAFAPEPMLGRVAPGTEVTLTSDSGGPWRGRIGYVSPVAEFTPKTIETPELRSQLVYRLRVRVENPDDRLRQGMPITIHLPAR